MAMKLIELLNTLDEGTLIKVGTTDGNSFFYAGELNADAIDTIEEIGKPSYGKLVAAISKAEKVIANLEMLEPTKNNNRTLVVNREKLGRLTAFRKRYTDILHREVADSFIADPLVEHERTIVIIIDGWECGRYWTIEEAQRERRNRNGVRKVS